MFYVKSILSVRMVASDTFKKKRTDSGVADGGVACNRPMDKNIREDRDVPSREHKDYQLVLYKLYREQRYGVWHDNDKQAGS